MNPKHLSNKSPMESEDTQKAFLLWCRRKQISATIYRGCMDEILLLDAKRKAMIAKRKDAEIKKTNNKSKKENS